MKNNKKAQVILRLLKEHYPEAKMILQWNNNFELLAAVILSAQCTDLMVNKVTAKVFPKYRQQKEQFLSYYKQYSQLPIPTEEIIELVNFAYVSLGELEKDIKSTGFYRNKARHLQGAARIILNEFKGNLPKSMLLLQKIPGVGRKTANVFLGNAYHLFEGIAVDTHVKKQAKKLGLTREDHPDKIEQELMQLFDKKEWFTLTYLLIAHGRNMRKKKSDRIICGNNTCLLCQ